MRALPFFPVACLLVACGGASIPDVPAISREKTLYAESADCSDLKLHDSGEMLYIVAGRDCALEGPMEMRIGMRGAGQASAQTVEVRMSLGEEIEALDVPGTGLRRVELHRTGEWRRLSNADSWQHRDGAGLLLLRGELYLLGGWNWSDTSSEVWKTRDLVQWEFLGNAPWSPRHGAAWLVHRDRLYVIGGDWMTDAWSSYDGVAWTRHTTTAPFGTLYTPNAVSVDDRIVLYGGQGGTEGVNDVWSSEDGSAWDALPVAPWAGRGLIHGHAFHAGRFYVIGGGVKAVPPGGTFGETKHEFSDIWSSSNGLDWRQEADTLGFAPRTHFSVVSTPRGCYVSDGSVGTQGNVTNDLFFADDCVHFAPVPDVPPLEPRHASSLAYFNGSLVILGGPPAGDAGTAVWQYFP